MTHPSSCRARRRLTYVEVLVVVLLLVVLVAFLLPSCNRVHHGDELVKCASNLRQIGLAILLYSNENQRAYPHVRATTGPSVLPVWGTGVAATNPFADDGPQPNDVTAALFLLLRTQDITSEVFNCPSTDLQKDTYGGGDRNPMSQSNFTDWRKHLSYSYQNPYPDDAAVKDGFKLNNSISAEFAVAADMNPGVSGESGGVTDNVLGPTPASSAREMKPANSPNHDRDGQNVLFGDGHVEFLQNPFVGIQRNHIYTRSGPRGKPTDPPTNDAQDPFGSPRDANDSVLLPTDD
jgi:prepilin-type processing-associated H-X9-DG protein